MSIGEVSFFTGIILFFIGIIGGGIDIKEVKIPQITGASRFACFLGSVMFIALGLYLKDVIPATAITNTLDTLTSKAESTNVPSTQQTVATNNTPANPTPSPAQTEEIELARKNARKQLEEATERLNIVWNGTTKEIRDTLSPEQLQWLKQRESDCSRQASSESNTVLQETVKYSCMATMTDPRIEVLKQKIAATVIPEPIPNNSSPTNTTSISDNNQAQAEEAELARNKAKEELDEANKRINIVWNATTKEIRETLLAEQRQWLTQREDDCAHQASSEKPDDRILQETIKFRCMAAMTDPRTEELTQEIAAMSQ